MKLKKLSRDEVISLFNERLISDFAKDEIKPLNVIIKAIDDGIYECLGLFEGEAIVGYTFLVRIGMNYLIDYFAVYPTHRNAGIGSHMLSCLSDYLSRACLIIAEVEDPAYTEDEEAKALQKRRIEFYKRNGCRDTGLRVRCMGVPFIILETENSTSIGKDALWVTYQSFYKTVLPNEMFENNIKYLDFIPDSSS